MVVAGGWRGLQGGGGGGGGEEGREGGGGGEGGRQRWASIGDSGEWQRLWTNSRWSQYSTTHGQTSSGRTPASLLASRLTRVGRSCEGGVEIAKWGVMSLSELNEVLLSKGSQSPGRSEERESEGGEEGGGDGLSGERPSDKFMSDKNSHLMCIG